MEGALRDTLERAFRLNVPKKLGVAVSGGSDSVALLNLLCDYRSRSDIQLHAVTIDHRLRTGSASEAVGVAALCEDLGVPHEVLKWSGWHGQGNLQNEARKARYGLMANWAIEREIPVIALGHTANDQAETVLMRLARRSGVDGLSGMPMRHVAQGVDWLRPLLGQKREALRDYLRNRGVGWVDDPSNDDLGYERIRARRALSELAPLGIDVDTLCVVANNMFEARKALGWQAFTAARAFANVCPGAVVFSHAKLRLQPDEIIRRLLVQAIMYISGSGLPPRREAVSQVLNAVDRNKGSTLDGCRVVVWRSDVWIFREAQAVVATKSALSEVWDSRWKITSSAQNDSGTDFEVRMLGEAGIVQIAGWRQMGRPREMLLATPAVWSGDEVVAAPLARDEKKWFAEWDGDDDRYFAALLSH